MRPAWWHGLYPKGSGNRKGLGPGERIRAVPGVEVGVAGVPGVEVGVAGPAPGTRLADDSSSPVAQPSLQVSEVGVDTSVDTLPPGLSLGAH